MRRAPPRRRRAPHISLPRSAPRQRTKPGASHRRGAARGRGSTAPADGAAAAADESMRARRWEGRPPAASLSYRRCSNYFAARLPGLDSRRAAACFSSSSPVGAIFACRLLRVLLGCLGERLDSARRPRCWPRLMLHPNGRTRERTAGVVASGRRRPGADPAAPGQRRAHRCINDARCLSALSPARATSAQYNISRRSLALAPTKNHPLLRRSRRRTRSASSRRPRPR